LFSALSSTIVIIIGLIVFLGLLLFLAGIRRLWRGKSVSGSFQGLMGLLLITAAALAGTMSLNLYTYHRLIYEKPVAEIRFKARSPRQFWVFLMPTDKNPIVLELRGDEWQMDARILKWRGFPLLLGLDTVFRLDRLSGRYRDIDQERKSPHTVYKLSEDPGLDIWAIARRYKKWIPWVDTIYGSATYMPMADGARYNVSLSTSGLLARPSNEKAQEAVRQWR
jgi:heme/copper-type cytochrome/quinol oxidase subunit 2